MGEQSCCVSIWSVALCVIFWMIWNKVFNWKVNFQSLHWMVLFSYYLIFCQCEHILSWLEWYSSVSYFSVSSWLLLIILLFPYRTLRSTSSKALSAHNIIIGETYMTLKCLGCQGVPLNECLHAANQKKYVYPFL